MDELGGSQDDMIDYLLAQMAGPWKNEIPSWTRCSNSSTSICPDEWAAEIERINCDSAWVNVVEGQNLTDEYYNRNIGVAEKAIAKAGVRLAAILNEIF